MMKLVTIQLFILIIVLQVPIWVNQAIAEVDPPNYEFSLDSLSVFYPGSTMAQMEEAHGKGELIKDAGEVKTYRFYVAQIRYKFPVFVQIYRNKSLDFFAKLPSYFLHDVFHQSMINRYGKQETFYKKEGTALYIWNNEEGTKFTYAGTCTITCFPIYLSGTYASNENNELPSFQSLLKQFAIKR